MHACQIMKVSYSTISMLLDHIIISIPASLLIWPSILLFTRIALEKILNVWHLKNKQLLLFWEL